MTAKIYKQMTRSEFCMGQHSRSVKAVQTQLHLAELSVRKSEKRILLGYAREAAIVSRHWYKEYIKSKCQALGVGIFGG